MTAALTLAVPLAADSAANHSQIDLMSIGPSGGNGAPHAFYGGNSADGSRLFFTTNESLVSADTDSSDDVYERAGGATTLISTGPINGNGAHQARFGGASADGTRVFFDTSEQLTTSDTDSARDVYERFAGTTTHLSIGPNGGNSAIDSFYSGNSTDGTKVFMMSYDALTSNDTDTGRKDVYQRSGATTTLLSTGGNGDFGADYDGATPNGTHVFFHTDESLAASDTDGIRDVYDASGGTTTHVSRGSINGNGAFDPTWKGASEDGSIVFFQTSEQLTASDTDTYGDVYQRSGGTTTKVSLGPNGGNGAFDANFAKASADGSKVWMETREPLVSGDTDGFCEDENELFIIECLDVYERSGGSTTLISAGGNGSHEASFAAASTTGNHVFFHTTEQLSPDDNTDTTFDIYDRSGGNTILVTPGDGAAFLQGISKDGARVFFHTYHPLVGADTDIWNDVYERYGGTTTLISTGPASSSGNNIAWFYGNSDDGTRVFFDTDEILTSADTDTSVDIYSANQVLTGYPRPKGASPSSISLVPAYTPCTTGFNRNHGPPLAHPSCNPPVQLSPMLTVGSPDTNGFPAGSTSRVKFMVTPGAPGPPDDSSVQVLITVNDVRCRVTNAACPGGSGSDFAGSVLFSSSVRLTDKLNGSPAVESATVQDFPLQIPVSCATTADPATGGNCALTTTLTALLPGSVLDAKRAMWALGTLEVHDPGPNGTGYGSGCSGGCGDGDESVFMTQGIFTP